MQQNEHEVPRLGITICVDPPNDNKEQEPLSSGSIDWTTGQFSPNNSQPFYPGYPSPSPPQPIPKINTTYDIPPPSSPNGIWDSRSPTSSDSGWSNPPSPLIDQFGDEFHDDASEFFSETRSPASEFEFDIETFLSLGSPDVVHSPDSTSPDFLSGPDTSPLSPSLPNSSPLASQPLQYASPYNPGQSSPTFGLGFPNSFPNNSHDLSSMRPTHHRTSSDYLSPPSPTMIRGSRPHSRGPTGHRSTISEGSNAFLSPDINPELPLFFEGDLRGRGLSRAKSAPSSKPVSRGRSPYDRPASQTGIAGLTPRLDIPNFIRPISGPSTPDQESPSPSSAKDVVATDAMVQASIKRRKREANYFCLQCGATFTTENSKKRHESSHSGEKPYTCSIAGCGQTFSNIDDRKRHENKSKKHAQSI